MLTRFALWVRLLFPFFGRVTLESTWLDRIREQAQRGRVVHVAEVQGLLDFALLNYLFLKHKLPLATVTNTRIGRWLRPVLVLLLAPLRWLLGRFGRTSRVEDFVQEIRGGGTGFLFLKRARFVMVPGGNIGFEYLKGLVQLQRTIPDPIILVPQVIFWTKNPEKYRRSVLELLLGDPNAPGLRKLLTFLMRSRRTHVTSGEPVNVMECLTQTGEHDNEVAARKLSWLVHRSIDLVEKVTRGPMLKNAAQIRNEMLANPDFVAGIEAAGTEMNLSPREARRRATRYITEIAADFRVSYIEGLSFMLTPVFKRVFSSFVVDRDAMQAIREASKDSSVILVPCHRSHIDYLIISYLMYLHGVIPPHIAAGANLSFFPMGHIFRHCGAFFIRRRIGGDRIYAFTLAQYIRKIIKEGHSIEFFIEGGRSRTGKTLPPRFGLLNYVADAVVGEAVRDVKVIPIALSYEQIMEVEGYAQELAGKDKRKEDLTGLVKSAEVLDSRYGRLYLTAGRPIHVADFFERTANKKPRELTEEEKRYLVKRLGYLILGRINRATVINPSGLVATALLSHHRRGISKNRFLETVGFLLDFALKRGYPISMTLDQALKSSMQQLARVRDRAEKDDAPRLVWLAMGQAVAPILDEAVDRFEAMGHVRTETFDEEPVISVLPSARMYLNYYRNNILHVYQREALVALSIIARRAHKQVTRGQIEEDVRYLSQLLKKEFIFRVGDLRQGIIAGLDALERQGIVAQEADGNVVPDPDNLDRLYLFRNMVLPIVESYLICARYAPLVRFKGAMKGRDLARAILERARKDYGQGEITCQEALSTVNILNAIDRYQSMEVLTTVASGLDSGKIRFAKGSALEDLERISKRLEPFAEAV